MKTTAPTRRATQPDDELAGFVELLAEWAVEDYLREQQVAQPQSEKQRQRAASNPKKAGSK